jgi:hypothetical protein
MTPLLPERVRAQEPNHVRTTEVQTLDALLRIEETLVSILEGMRHFASQLKAKPAEVTPEEAPAGRRSRK